MTFENSVSKHIRRNLSSRPTAFFLFVLSTSSPSWIITSVIAGCLITSIHIHALHSYRRDTPRQMMKHATKRLLYGTITTRSQYTAALNTTTEPPYRKRPPRISRNATVDAILITGNTFSSRPTDELTTVI